MTEQLTGPTTEEAVVLELTDEDAARMRELHERIEAQGGLGPDDSATRGAFGSAASMIAEAKKHLGYVEEAGNVTIFNRWLGPIGNSFGYFWCHSFQSYCLAHSDNADAGPRTASCVAGVKWFTDRGRFGSTPHVGDLVYYGPGGGTHVELVIGVAPDAIQTIGGNTGGTVDGKAFFNGNGVYTKSVKRTPNVFGYGSPQYSVDAVPAAGIATTPATAPPASTPFTKVRSVADQQTGVNSLGFTPPLGVDGKWGPKTEAGVKWLQTRVGTTPDGRWGAETERLFKALGK